MSKSTKFVIGLFQAVFVIALFAMKPASAEGVPPELDLAVRALGIVVGMWIAAILMQPFVSAFAEGFGRRWRGRDS